MGRIRINALLFQCGYLTIKSSDMRDDGNTYYILDYPNQEVRQSLNRALLGMVSGDLSESLDLGSQPSRLLGDNDFEGFRVALPSFYAVIPHQ